MLCPEQRDDLRLYIHRRILLRLHHHDVPQRALLTRFGMFAGMDCGAFDFFLVAGQIAAMLLFDSVIWLASADAPTAEISAIMAFALPMCSLVFLDEKNSSSGWGAICPGQDDTDERSTIAKRLSSEFALTPREVDVALILAKGRNKERAAEELHLARETVKTHAANIYRKLAIHSQQELIDLIEGLL